MRYWYIMNDYGEYEGKDKTFEGAYFKVCERIKSWPLKSLYIINEQQYEDLNIDGWCEGGLHITKDGMEDTFEIESLEYWREEEMKAYRRSTK